MLTRHDDADRNHLATCRNPDCPCGEEIGEALAERRAEAASDWDADHWDGRYEDRYVWREAS